MKQYQEGQRRGRQVSFAKAKALHSIGLRVSEGKFLSPEDAYASWRDGRLGLALYQYRCLRQADAVITIFQCDPRSKTGYIGMLTIDNRSPACA